MSSGPKGGSADAADTLPTLRGRSPALPLIIGLVGAILVTAGVGVYMMSEVARLRDEQTRVSEQNRKDALQLIRISNDLASLSSLMRDMVDSSQPYPLDGWQPAFARVRTDLSDALAIERGLAPAAREPEQQARLESSAAAYWAGIDRVFGLARQGQTARAIDLVRADVTQRHRELSSLVSQLLVVNNRMQEEAALANRGIFDRVRGEMRLLIVALTVLMAITGGLVIAANHRAFR